MTTVLELQAALDRAVRDGSISSDAAEWLSIEAMKKQARESLTMAAAPKPRPLLVTPVPSRRSIYHNSGYGTFRDPGERNSSMSRDEFDSAGEYVSVRDLEGELVLFTPREYVEEVPTTFGTKDAVVTDLVVLSQPGRPEYEDVMIFQGTLIGALKRRIKVTKSLDRDPASGVVTNYETTTVKRVLGVIAKGEAKKGQNAPYILEAPTDEQKVPARIYMEEVPTPEPVKRQVSQYVDTGAVTQPIVATAVAQPVPTVDEFAPASEQYSADEDPFAVKQ